MICPDFWNPCPETQEMVCAFKALQIGKIIQTRFVRIVSEENQIFGVFGFEGKSQTH